MAVPLIKLLRAKYPADDKESRMSAKSAGYMELDGAEKDGDCEIVKVEGGVSSDKGCCNYFKPEKGAKQFKCGTCRELL